MVFTVMACVYRKIMILISWPRRSSLVYVAVTSSRQLRYKECLRHIIYYMLVDDDIFLQDGYDLILTIDGEQVSESLCSFEAPAIYR